MTNALVVLPTYNERDNLERILTRILAENPTVTVLVVDDSSPDGTGELADQLAAANDALQVMHRTEKNGLGEAYRAAFAWALERGYDPIIEMDADGSHLPEELPRLLAAFDGDNSLHKPADLVIGSRWVHGGTTVNWPWYRKFISRGGSWYTRTMLGISIKDATAGFRVFRASTLRTIPLGTVSTRGYGFQVDMLYRTLQAGLTVVEVPVTFVEREFGRSKMSGGIVVEAMVQVTKWGFQRLVGRGPRSGRP